MAGLKGLVLLGTHSSKSPSVVKGRRWSSQAAATAMARADLKRWVKEQGGFVWSGLNLVHQGDDEGMGLVASQELPSGTTIIALPRRVPLVLPSNRSNPRDAVLCDLAERIPEELWALRLGLKLLAERAQKGSFWWPYISLLPQTFSVPMFFQATDIENIDYAPLTHQVKRRCKFLLSFSSELSSVLHSLPEERHPFGGQTVDSGALGWAMAAVSSRAFRTHNVDNNLCSAMMLPLIDMCNHSLKPNARIVEDPSKEAQDSSFLKVITEVDIKPGQAITINYGPLSNDLLLLDYGFVIPDNPHDRVEVRYDGTLLENARLLGGLSQPEGKDALSFTSPAPWQVELLKQLGLWEHGDSQKVNIGGPELVDGRLLAALRILYSTEVIQPVNLSSLQSWNGSLGVENEQKVVRTLCVLAVVLVNHFKQTVAEDEAYLATNKGMPQSTRLIVQFRLSKKKILLTVLNSLKVKLRDLLKAGVA